MSSSIDKASSLKKILPSDIGVCTRFSSILTISARGQFHVDGADDISRVLHYSRVGFGFSCATESGCIYGSETPRRHPIKQRLFEMGSILRRNPPPSPEKEAADYSMNTSLFMRCDDKQWTGASSETTDERA